MNDEIVDTAEGPVPMNIATISAGFEKGDFLVREEQGNRVYFDFFEEVSGRTNIRDGNFSSIRDHGCCFRCHLDVPSYLPCRSYLPVALSIQQAFNYISNKGYARMSREDEKHWVDLMNVIHDSVKGGMKYNTGTLLMVLSRPVNTDGVPAVDKKEVIKTKTPSKDSKVMNP
jgi:hypothetical protein